MYCVRCFVLPHPLLQELGLQVVDDSGVLSVVIEQGERKMKTGVRQAHGKSKVRGSSFKLSLSSLGGAARASLNCVINGLCDV